MECPSHRPRANDRTVPEPCSIDVLDREPLRSRTQDQGCGRENLCLDPGQVLNQVRDRPTPGAMKKLRGGAKATHVIVGERSDPRHSMAV